MAEDHAEQTANPYLTIDEAAERLKVKRTTLNKWRGLGKGPAYRDHGVIVYHVDDLDAWSRARRRTQTPGGERRHRLDAVSPVAGEPRE